MSIVEDLRASIAEFPGAAPALQKLALQQIANWKSITPADATALLVDAAPTELTVELEPLLQMAVLRISQAWRSPQPVSIAPEALARIALLHAAWKQTPAARDALLTILACAAGPAELALFAKLVSDAPPQSHDGSAVAFAPLFQQKQYDPSPLFPQLFETFESPFTAAAALDLSNFVTRQEIVDRHPGADRVETLANLLGALSQRLDKLTDNPQAEGDSPDDIATKIAESVGLAVALCDALALIGDEKATPKLYQALEVRHRRLRTEAAAALAKLGEEKGQQALVELAAEPVARLRVISYSDELGISDQIPNEFLTDAARAESELAVALSQPTYYGIPPSRLELVDERELYWPSYNEPVDCFLFKFSYSVRAASGSLEAFSNFGIAGPIAHTLSADLTELPIDDVYAIFAGWCVEHEDIFELDLHDIGNQVDVDRLARKIRDEGFDAVQPVALHSFLNERVLLAIAVKDGQAVSVAMGAESHAWLPKGNVASPPGPMEAYHLFKGRKLLRSFND